MRPDTAMREDRPGNKISPRRGRDGRGGGMRGSTRNSISLPQRGEGWGGGSMNNRGQE
jgi:hypothetical protein